ISRPFWMGVFPVTVGQYRTFVQATNDTADADEHWASPGFEQTDDCPVTRVSWDDAAEFLKWLSGLKAERERGRVYRLPREAEWEYSCRGGAASYQIFHVGTPSLPRRPTSTGTTPPAGLPSASFGNGRRQSTPSRPTATG